MTDYERIKVAEGLNVFWQLYDEDSHGWQSLEDCVRQALLTVIQSVAEDMY